MTGTSRVWGLAAILLLSVAPGARAEWVVDDKGECVERWSGESMLRGPTAMLMAPTAPFRTAAGVFAYQSPSADGWHAPRAFWFWGPVTSLLSFCAGFIDTVGWLGTGLADTLTGGAFAIAPDKATQLTLDAMIPPFMSDSQRQAIEAKRPDACGRTRSS